jgi:hypothetical protein
MAVADYVWETISLASLEQHQLDGFVTLRTVFSEDEMLHCDATPADFCGVRT